MRPMTKLPRLPLEIIIEIFLWLPVISLMRFRSVSKFFNNLVLDPDFTYDHHQRSMIRDGGTRFLMAKIDDLYAVDLNENGKTSRWNLNFHGQYFTGSCVNGLYCIWKHWKEPVRILNPSTRKMIQLPYWKKNCHSIITSFYYYYALGYEPIEKTYKVLMKVEKSRGRIKNFIFTLGVDKSWRKIKSTINFFPCIGMKGCSIKGVIYMLDYLKKCIVAFDLRAENFRIIELSNDMCENTFDYGLLEVKGQMAVLDCSQSFVGRNYLWILQNSEKEEWKSHNIRVPLKWKHVEDIVKPVAPRGFYNCRDGEIIFIGIKNNVIECYFYDVGKSSWRYLEIPGIPTKGGICGINIYVENLCLC